MRIFWNLKEKLENKCFGKIQILLLTMARSTLLIGFVNFVKKNGLNVNLILLILHKNIVLVREETQLSWIWQDQCCTKRICLRYFCQRQQIQLCSYSIEFPEKLWKIKLVFNNDVDTNIRCIFLKSLVVFVLPMYLRSNWIK